MKGIVFTEFLDLVEDTFGLETVEDIIEKSNLPSKGAYTSIGTYAFSEMISLVNHLSENTSMTVEDLLHVYGHHFFGAIKRDYAYILDSYTDPLDLLSSVGSHIHVEVRKIYPDAELPNFEVVNRNGNSLTLTYFSSRSLYAFGLGLMEKAFEYYERNATITFNKIKEDGSEVKFVILEHEGC